MTTQAGAGDAGNNWHRQLVSAVAKIYNQ